MTTRDGMFLDDIVLALVREFGTEKIQDALSRAGAFHRKGEPKRPDEKPPSQSDSRQAPTARKRVSAMELVARTDLAPARRAAVKQLAENFDRKTFLPSSSDIREFLIMSGERPPTLKDRTEAFRFILPVLNRIPVDRLNYVIATGAHSGPTQLSTISDAISAAGERRRTGPSSKDAVRRP